MLCLPACAHHHLVVFLDVLNLLGIGSRAGSPVWSKEVLAPEAREAGIGTEVSMPSCNNLLFYTGG